MHRGGRPLVCGRAGVGGLVEAARFRGFGVLLSVWGSCYKESSGCVVVVVREPVSDAA